MTSQLKESNLCTGEAKVSGDKIVFGCQKNLASASEEIRNHFKCSFWDMEIYSICSSCSLDCIKNENEDLAKIKKQREKLEELMNKSINPLMASIPITPSDAQKISRKYKKLQETESVDRECSEQAMEAAEFASGVMSAVLSGKQIDMAYFKGVANHIVSKAASLNPDAKIEDIDFKKMEETSPYRQQNQLIKKNMKIK
tara:strand:+ start:125042 stop:125638 length:597 start_codon:yes stop_codon:yes gene_type:complete